MSPLNQYVNYYPKAVTEVGTRAYYGTKIPLGKVLESMHARHYELVSRLRTLPKEKQRAFKDSELPCFTVSGYFEKDGKGSRNAKDMAYFTGAICLDLDVKDGSADNLKVLKKQVTSEPFVSFACDSCRGEGIFVIIHVAEPERHESYFDFLVRWLELNGCLSNFDESTKNKNRLRFVSYDENYFINYDTTPLSLPRMSSDRVAPCLKNPGSSKLIYFKIPGSKIDFATTILTRQGVHFVEGNKHTYIYKLCRLLNKLGVAQVEAEAFISNLISLQSIKSNCITYPYKTYSSEFNTWNRE